MPCQYVIREMMPNIDAPTTITYQFQVPTSYNSFNPNKARPVPNKPVAFINSFVKIFFISLHRFMARQRGYLSLLFRVLKNKNGVF